MAEKKRRLSSTATLKNKIRGAAAALRNRTPARTPQGRVDAKRHALQSLKHAVGEARATVRGYSRSEFENWVAGQYTLSNHGAGIGTRKELLGVLPTSLSPLSLESELENAATMLARHYSAFTKFLDLLRRLSELIELGDYEAALQLIDSHVEEEGYSYWAVEAKIAMLNAHGKNAAAKELVAELSAGPAGINAFYYYHIGLRNETAQSSSRFRSLIARRLSDSTLTKEYVAYTNYRIARILPSDRKILATLLAYEGFSTKIDLYLTASRIAVEVLCSHEAFSVGEVEHSLKILALFRNSPLISQISENSLKLCDPLRKNIEQAVASAIAGQSQENGAAHSMSSGIAAVVSLSGSEADEEAQRKYLLNFWWISKVMLVDSAGELPKIVEIYADIWNPIEKQSHPFINAYIGEFRRQAALHSFFGSDDTYIDAGLGFEDRLSDASPTMVDCVCVRATWDAFHNAEYSQALKLAQYSLLHNPRLLPVLPLRRMFDAVSFSDIREYGISIDVCNCLHWYSQQSTERQIRTFKRFAIEEWIESSGFLSIIDAAAALMTSGKDKLAVEFFLYNACDLSTIELLLEVESTTDAKQIRATLLRLCGQLNPELNERVTAEADELLEQLEVDAVLTEIDETMVSVDEEALLPPTAREIAADFERYRKLSEGKESEKSSIDALMKSLRQQSASTFQIPESESADLLVQMVQTVLDRFIDDPVSGLDAIMGRRIRHGTISSELRGTLEQKNLIGHRPRTGADYDVPIEIGKYLAKFDSDVRRGVLRAYSRFSATIDTLVAQLRDEVFQCKQKGKRRAVFELPLGTAMFALARDTAKECQSADVYCQTLFQIFWLLLSVRVESDRYATKEYLERTLHEACNKFASELKASKFEGVEFFSSLQKASEELQLKADLIANWIRVPQVSNEGRTFQLTLVFDAAIALCKSRRSGFEPNATQSIDPRILLKAHGYPIVFDALSIAIENIAEHSGIRSGNRIDTRIALSDDNSRLCFSIVSDIKKGDWNSERQAKLDSIKDEISRESFGDRAKRTKGSGLAKLATIVRKHDGCRIDFSLLDNNQRFNLYFELRANVAMGAAVQAELEEAKE